MAKQTVLSKYSYDQRTQNYTGKSPPHCHHHHHHHLFERLHTRLHVLVCFTYHHLSEKAKGSDYQATFPLLFTVSKK